MPLERLHYSACRKRAPGKPADRHEQNASFTMLDRLAEHLRSRDVVHDTERGRDPVDGSKQEGTVWLQLCVSALVSSHLGAYPHAGPGPAIWIRCLVDRTLTMQLPPIASHRLLARSRPAGSARR